MPTSLLHLAALIHSLRHAFGHAAGAANARPESVMGLLVRALGAALGLLDDELETPPTLAELVRTPSVLRAVFAARRLGAPFFRAARHGGPVPARRHRIGRTPTWFAANRGRRAVPGRLRRRLPMPARAPPPAPRTAMSASSLQATPQPGRAVARPVRGAPRAISDRTESSGRKICVADQKARAISDRTESSGGKICVP